MSTLTTDQEAHQSRNNPFERSGLPARSIFEEPQSIAPEHNVNDMATRNKALSGSSFTQEIEEHKRRLEAEFQEFERSLNGRDTTVDLDNMDWDDLEASYNNEVQPHVVAEQEIMTEFGARFEVCECHLCLWD